MLSTMKVKESNSNSCGENKALAYQILKILELVNEGGKNFINISKKDLIIFIGGTQVGKSTTINALLGVPLQENDVGYIEPIPPNEFVAPVGDGRQNCTELPTLYEKEGFNFCFLDTQGFFEGRGEDLVIASSILMEIAIRKAKSVRVVFLGKMSDLQCGYAELTAKFCVPISKIISNSTTPIFFLWNRYTPQGKTNMRDFYNLPENIQNEIIMNKIIKEMGTYINNENTRIVNSKNILRERYENIGENYNQEIIQDLNDNITRIERENTLYSLVKKSFDDNNYGYIDPTDNGLISKFIEKIKECQAVNKCDLMYGQYSAEIVRFREELTDLLPRQFSFLKKRIFTKSYNNKIILNIINQFNSELKIDYDNLGELRGLNDTEEFQNRYNDEKVKNIKTLENLISNLEKRISDLDNDINGMNKSTVFWKCQINENATLFAWWRKYLVVYPYNGIIDRSTIMYDEIEEILEPHTHLRTVIENESPNYKAWYESDFGYGCHGEVIFKGPRKEKEKSLFEQKINELINTRTQIRDRNKELKDLRDKTNSLILIIERKENEFKKFYDIKKFVEQVNQQWKKKYLSGIEYCELIKSLKIIIEKLYPKEQIEKKKTELETINEFLELYEKIESTKPIDIKISQFDINDQISHLADFINTYDYFVKEKDKENSTYQ